MFGLCGSFTYAATVDNKRTNTTEDTCLIKKVKSKTSSLKKKKKKISKQILTNHTARIALALQTPSLFPINNLFICPFKERSFPLVLLHGEQPLFIHLDVLRFAIWAHWQSRSWLLKDVRGTASFGGRQSLSSLCAPSFCGPFFSFIFMAGLIKSPSSFIL